MQASTLSGKARDRVLAILAEHVSGPGGWIDRARAEAGPSGLPVCSVAVDEYFDLRLPESEAEALLRQVEEHRTDMAAGLGRDPGLVVAGCDYLSGVPRRRRLVALVDRGANVSRRRAAETVVPGPADFRSALERELERRRRRPASFSVVRFSLDRMRTVREIYGPLLADIAYERAAEVVRGALRDTDLACRDDGDGFSVLLPHTDRLAAHEAADRTRSRIARSFDGAPVAGRDLSLTVSGGIAVFPEDGGAATDLVRRADDALEASRKTGGDRIRVGHSERRRDLRRRAREGWSVLVAGGREEIGVPAEPLDLGRGGILVTTSDHFRPAERVRVFLGGVGGGAAAAETLEADGTVARIAPARVGEGRWRLGVSFDRPIPGECVRSRVRPWPSAATRGSMP